MTTTPDPTVLTANGWTAETLDHPDGRTVERWYGPAPRANQLAVGLNLNAAWTVHRLAVDRGLIEEKHP